MEGKNEGVSAPTTVPLLTSVTESHCFLVTGKRLGCCHIFAPEEEEKPVPDQRTC